MGKKTMPQICLTVFPKIVLTSIVYSCLNLKKKQQRKLEIHYCYLELKFIGANFYIYPFLQTWIEIVVNILLIVMVIQHFTCITSHETGSQNIKKAELAIRSEPYRKSSKCGLRCPDKKP